MARKDGKPEELRVVILGGSGSGKSATGNTILGKRAFTTRQSQDTQTLTCQAERGEFEGTPVSVVDTPETTRPNSTETSKSISYCAPGPHAFLLVIPLEKCTDVERQVKGLQQTFGKEASRYTIVLFTRGDELPDGFTTVELIHQNPLPDGVGYHVFNNRDEDPSQVRELLEKINSMVQRNGGSYYTNEMFEAAERAKQEDAECHNIKDRDWKDNYLYPIATAVTIGGGIGAASGGTVGGVAAAVVGSAIGAVAAGDGGNRAAAGAVAVVGAFTVGTFAGIGASAGLVPVLGFGVFMVALFVLFPVFSGIAAVLFFAVSEVGAVAQYCVAAGGLSLYLALANGGGAVTADTGPADVLRTVVVYGGFAAKAAAAIFAGADTAGAAFEVFGFSFEVCFCAKGAIICGAVFGAAVSVAVSAAVGVDTGEDFGLACTTAFSVVIVFLLLLFLNVREAPSAFNKTVGCTIAGVSVGAAFGAAVVVLGASGFVAGGIIIIACKAVAMWLNRQG